MAWAVSEHTVKEVKGKKSKKESDKAKE